MDMGKKAAYLRGLIDGLGLDKTTKEGKVISLMSDILEEAAQLIEDLQKQMDEIVEVVDIIDRDLDVLENDFYGEDNYAEYFNENYGGFFRDGFCEISCPACGESVRLTDDMMSDGFANCPECDEYLEFDYRFGGEEEYDEYEDEDGAAS
jgi:hypothetical protein